MQNIVYWPINTKYRKCMKLKQQALKRSLFTIRLSCRSSRSSSAPAPPGADGPPRGGGSSRARAPLPAGSALPRRGAGRRRRFLDLGTGTLASEERHLAHHRLEHSRCLKFVKTQIDNIMET